VVSIAALALLALALSTATTAAVALPHQGHQVCLNRAHAHVRAVREVDCIVYLEAAR
jgi:hypothetical protein